MGAACLPAPNADRDRMNPARTRIKTVCAILAIVIAFALRAHSSGQAFVDEVAINRDRNEITVDFTVKNIVAGQMVEALDSGLPVRIVYKVRFVRKAAALTTAVLNDIQFERVIEKDNLKNRYRIKEKEDTKEFPDLDSAAEVLSRVKGLVVAPTEELLPEKRYQIELQVKLEEFRLPFQLHRILPFFSLWDVTTPVKTVRVPNDGADAK